MIFSSTSGTQALGRNIRHVKELTFTSEDLGYYYNCVQSFEGLKEQCDDDIGPQPTWYPALSPRTPRTCQVVALPPMTRLSQFEYYLINLGDWWTKMPVVGKPPVILAQLCWLITHNPHLTILRINFIPVMTSCNYRFLYRTIASLKGIKSLDFAVECHPNRGFQLGLDLLNCLSPSIQSFIFNSIQLSETYEEHDHSETRDGGSSSELVMMPRRQGPLTELLELTLEITSNGTTAADVISVFAQCPNIQMLDIRGINWRYNVRDIGGLIGRQCPHINRLLFYSTESDEIDSLPYWILQELPPQQIIEFKDTGKFSDMSFPAANPLLLKHSTTLRTLSLSRENGDFSRISAGVIFDKCVNLEVLEMGVDGGGVYIDLADAQGSPWCCTKLKRLTISVSNCVLPPIDAESLHYYDRPAPIALTQAETDLLSRLEKLYIQIGRLTKLQDLDIKMVKFDEQGEVDKTSAESHTFPAMLSLGDRWQGRPGYLGHLAGLSKLETFMGSVRADSRENKVTMEWKECVWINEHWPRLSQANFFYFKKDVSAPFTWLQKQRRHGRDQLKLSWAPGE